MRFSVTFQPMHTSHNRLISLQPPFPAPSPIITHDYSAFTWTFLHIERAHAILVSLCLVYFI